MISNDLHSWLTQASNGLLTKQAVQCLQLPDSTELSQLQYLTTRLQPTPSRFQFKNLADAKQFLTEYFACFPQAKAKVSARSNRAIEALLLVDPDRQGASVNPFTYGADLNEN